MRLSRTALPLLLLSLLVPVPQLPAGAPAHYYNDPRNLNPDPNYRPGDYPMEDTNLARAMYTERKLELAHRLDQGGYIATLGVGEIAFSSLKNESASVLGYFRNYFGIAKIGKQGVESVELVIDINSLDTAIPGRNNRILRLFFQSMKPEYGTAVISLKRFEPAGERKGARLVRASGEIRLNGVTKPLQARLAYHQENETWHVDTVAPIELKISDFNFGGRIYDLMKSCNHKSIANLVTVNAHLRLR